MKALIALTILFVLTSVIFFQRASAKEPPAPEVEKAGSLLLSQGWSSSEAGMRPAWYLIWSPAGLGNKLVVEVDPENKTNAACQFGTLILEDLERQVTVP